MPSPTPVGDAPQIETDAVVASRPTNRGFWIVLGAFVLAGLVVVVGAVLTRPAPPPGSARADLAIAADAALVVERTRGSLEEATADELLIVEVRLDFVDARTPSTRPSEISVYAGPDGWVGASRDVDGRCFAHALRTPDARGDRITGFGGGGQGDAPCTAVRWVHLLHRELAPPA